MFKICKELWKMSKSSKQSCRIGIVRIIRYWESFRHPNIRLITWKIRARIWKTDANYWGFKA